MPRRKVVPNKDLLTAALEGLEAHKRRIEEQVAQVRKMLGQRKAKAPAAEAPAAQPARRRKLSRGARKRIAAAQKKRWAEYRKKIAAAGKG
jgi:hypothetical protein